MYGDMNDATQTTLKYRKYVKQIQSHHAKHNGDCKWKSNTMEPLKSARKSYKLSNGEIKNDGDSICMEI